MPYKYESPAFMYEGRGVPTLEAAYVLARAKGKAYADIYVPRADEYMYYAVLPDNMWKINQIVGDLGETLNSDAEISEVTTYLCQNAQIAQAFLTKLLNQLLTEEKCYGVLPPEKDLRLCQLIRTCANKILELNVGYGFLTGVSHAPADINAVKRLHHYLGDELFAHPVHVNDFVFGRIVADYDAYTEGTPRYQPAEVIDFAVSHGANVNAISFHIGTLLHCIIANEREAAAIKYIEQLEALRKNPLLQARIARGELKAEHVHYQYNIVDHENKTPLLLAAKTGLNKLLIKLLNLHAKGFDIGLDIADDQGRTPLLIACALGNYQAVTLLAKAGAKLDAKDKYGRGIVEYSHLNQEEIAEIIRSMHTDPERSHGMNNSWLMGDGHRLLAQNPKGEYECVLLNRKNIPLIKSLYLEALEKGNKALASTIMWQLNMLLRASDISEIEHCLEEQRELEKSLCHQLRLFSLLGDTRSVDQLLDAGVDPNACDELNRNAAHYAVMREKLSKDILEKEKIKVTDMATCMANRAEVLAKLIQHGANLEAKNSRGNTVKEIIGRIDDSSAAADLSDQDKATYTVLKRVISTTQAVESAASKSRTATVVYSAGAAAVMPSVATSAMP
jgi:ankyrin repeat protein